jgi:hypothetical protein
VPECAQVFQATPGGAGEVLGPVPDRTKLSGGK